MARQAVAALLLSLLLSLSLLTGCGGHRPATRTIVLPAATSSGSVPVPPPSGGPAGGGGSAPTTSGSLPTPTTPTPPAGALALRVIGPGPARVLPGANEVLALALELRNATPEPLELRELSPRAEGRLDDPRGVRTARLAEDVDGDGRWDRAIDRVLATAGFQQDDGPLAFGPLRLPLAAGAAVRLLVVLDLGAPAVCGDELRLLLDPAAVRAETAAGLGAPVGVEGVGPLLRLGAWIEPHEALTVAGEGLFPRAARDGQGRTHLGLFQNANLRSVVHYSLFDGRRWSNVDDVSRSASSTAWNQDLAVDAADLPHLAWEEWDGGPGDVAIRWTAFDPQAFSWRPSERVSPGAGLRLAPRLAVTGGVTGAGAAQRVHVVWEQHDTASGEVRIHHRARDAAGAWGAIAEVSSAQPGVQAREPALVPLATGELLIAWSENGGAQSQVRARRLGPGGFSPLEPVARTNGLAARPELLSVGGLTVCAFQDGVDVFVSRRDPQGWSTAVNVSGTPNEVSREPALALHQNVLHVAWVEGSERVSLAEAQGGGFGAPLVLTRGPGARARPALVSEGERLRLVWQDRSLGRQRIFHTWKEPAPLETPRLVAAPGGDPARPAVTLAPDGSALAVWSLDAGGNREVFCAREAGGAFGPAENVSQSAGGSHQPDVAIVGTRSLVVWEEDGPSGFELRYALRDGAGWSTPAAVSSLVQAYTPRLAGEPDGRALLVFTARAPGGDHDVHVARFDGQTWATPVALAPDPAASSWSPSLARRADGAAWAVAWEEEQGPRRELRVAVLDPSGAAQVAPVASAMAGQYAPRVAWAGQNLHVTWVEDGRLKAAVRRAGQAAFDPPLELTQGGSWAPALADAGGQVGLVWEQWTGGDARVLLSLLGPGGWSQAAPLDLSSGPARAPALAGGPAAGLRAVWVEPGKLLERTRRER